MNDNRKSIFITGAASGIGQSAARLFGGSGWFVGLADMKRDGLESLAADIGPTNYFMEQLDVSDRTAYLEVLERFSQKTDGNLDILFNNAGVGLGTLFGQTDFADIERMIQVNLMGVVTGIHAAYSMLKRTPGSLCFTTSSSSAIIGVPGLATYSATKHAVKGLTEALAVEFVLDDISVADALPGQIDTPMMPEELKQVAPEKGMWRLMPPESVAAAVWASYHDDRRKLHWYIPEDLEKLEKTVAADPAAARDGSAKFFGSGTIEKVLEDS